MKITRMTQMPQDGNGKLAAFFDVQTDDGIVIKGFRLVNGPKGKFISPPSDKGKDGKYYDSIILPRDIKENLQKIAIDEYGK